MSELLSAEAASETGSQASAEQAARLSSAPLQPLSAEDRDGIRFEIDPFPSDDEEREAILEVRAQLGDAMFDVAASTDLLKRGVRGQIHKGADAPAAAIKLVLDGRAELGLDTILERSLDGSAVLMTELWQREILAVPDKYGHPVLVERMLNILPEAVGEATSVEQAVLVNAQVMEAAAKRRIANTALVHDSNRYDVSQQAILVDMTGLSVGHMSGKFLEVMTAVGKACNELYIDTVWRIYIVNAPLLFRVLWGLAQQFMSQVTIDKVQVLGEEDCQEAISRDLGVAVDALPPWLGGELPAQLLWDVAAEYGGRAEEAERARAARHRHRTRTRAEAEESSHGDIEEASEPPKESDEEQEEDDGGVGGNHGENGGGGGLLQAAGRLLWATGAVVALVTGVVLLVAVDAASRRLRVEIAADGRPIYR
jgi:hypothetical protein